MSQSKTQRILSIDALRALAILLVVFAHSGVPLVPGGVGVTLFFVISGYVITSGLIREFDKTEKFSIKNFYLRRFFKIFPPFLAVVVIPTIIFWNYVEIELQEFLAQIFFVYNWVKMDSPVGNLLGTQVVWSLSIEEQFYLLVAVIWLLLMRMSPNKLKRNLFFLYLVIFIISSGQRVFISFSYEGARNTYGEISRIYYGTDTRVSSIALGGLLALYLAQKIELHSRFSKSKNMRFCIYALVVLLFAASLFIREPHFRDTFRFTMQETASMFVCFIAIKWNFPVRLQAITESKIVQSIGISSYSIYLVHLIPITILWPIIDKHLNIKNYFLVPSTVFLALLLGYLCHLLFDQPFEKFRSRLR